uniref:Uncharacterized protein n=1 Tax=Rhizophora mucronata TaxID=61149 RepID=A0A2P2LNC8_RHIMU
MALQKLDSPCSVFYVVIVWTKEVLGLVENKGKKVLTTMKRRRYPV